MTRIAVGGFLHETNTFAPTKATYEDFVHGGGWPAMAQGAKLLEKMRNINVGLAGFVEQAEADGRTRRRADCLSHLSACRHGRHRPRRCEASRAAAAHQAALRKSVPAIAIPDSDQLAMHQ